MEIRKLSSPELPLLTQLFDYNDPEEMIKQNTRDIETGAADIFVMFDGDFPVGELHAAYISEDGRAEKGKRAYLFAFRIRDGHQGRGLGRRLLKYVINELEKQGYREFTVGVEDDNERAKHIYRSFGFTGFLARKYEEFQGDRYGYGLYLRRNKQ